MKNKCVKITNPHHPEYSKIDYILDETETQYVSSNVKILKSLVHV